MTANAKETEMIKSCEFKHRSKESLSDHAEAEKLKAEVEQVKLDIVQLKESNESKQKFLESFKNHTCTASKEI